jgi:hypothetical protein
METPTSVRLGKLGGKVQKACGRTGLKQPDVIKLAVSELLKRYPDDKALALAVMNFRISEAKKP